MEKKYYKVTYQHSESVYCSNIARAESAEAVEVHYSKYNWCSVSECEEWELESAQRRGMPIVEIETTQPEEPAQQAAETDQTAETMSENCSYCKRIADELEAIAAGKAVNEDSEEMSLYDWVNDALDFEYTVDSRRQYKAAKIWVTLGGPNVWVDTAEKAVKLAWGADRAEYPISYDTADAIDDVMAELWEVC